MPHEDEELCFTKILNIGDIVRICDELLVQELIVQDSELIGEVIGFIDEFIIVKTNNGEFNYQRPYLRWIDTPVTQSKQKQEAKYPDIKAQTRAREFMSGVRSKIGMNSMTWQDISEACQGSRTTLKEMHLAATTKIQKELIEKLPALMTEYISQTGDITDLDWVDNIFKSKVEELLEIKKQYPYHSKDWVRAQETGEVWQVRSFDGEWLSVISNDNKITSLHKTEVELVEQLTAVPA